MNPMVSYMENYTSLNEEMNQEHLFVQHILNGFMCCLYSIVFSASVKAILVTSCHSVKGSELLTAEVIEGA